MGRMVAWRMSANPLIGVTTSITVGPAPERAYVNSAYLFAVQQAGGVPVPLPPQLSAASLERLARGLDGLLLTGGGDLDPALLRGSAASDALRRRARAATPSRLRRCASRSSEGCPILAVCRGVQVLNVALGGSLFQDVGTEPGTAAPAQPDGAARSTDPPVTVKTGSRLAETLGADELEVNSMHHQAVKALGRGLVPVAWAPDQLIEGVEMTDSSRFVLGVQWHPEELVGGSEPARRLFAALVSSARS